MKSEECSAVGLDKSQATISRRTFPLLPPVTRESETAIPIEVIANPIPIEVPTLTVLIEIKHVPVTILVHHECMKTRLNHHSLKYSWS